MKLGMEPILTGPKVHRSNWHIFANPPNVIERQTIDPIRITITMSTLEIALVGEPKADRKTFVGGFFHHFSTITYQHDNPPRACSSMSQRHGAHQRRNCRFGNLISDPW